MAKTGVRWAAVLAVGLGAAALLARPLLLEARKANLYAAGEADGEAGRWPQAFARFRALAELDPGYRDVQAQLDQALGRTLTLSLGSIDLEAEVDLLRWLADSGDLTRLAQALDRSVVAVPAGEFLMGSELAQDERPERRVILDAFEIDRYEITSAQYQRFLRETGGVAPRYWQGGEYPAGHADRPVVGVSWQEASDYCRWAGKRLPTEAEWEKACRGPDGNTFPWGEIWDPARANVGYFQARTWPSLLDDGWALLEMTTADPDLTTLKPVGWHPRGASPYGALDLVGNASEWVVDWYNWDGYWDMPSENPVGEGPPWNHVLRGSAWFDRRGREGLVRDLSRCSARNSSHSYDDPRLGFRCARSVP